MARPNHKLLPLHTRHGQPTGIGFCHSYGCRPTEGTTRNSEVLQLPEDWTSCEQLLGALQAAGPKQLFGKGHLGYYRQSHSHCPRQSGEAKGGKGKCKGGFLTGSAVKDTPRSTNRFSVLENCMVGSTKDMLDSSVPPSTEEVVSKSEAPELADTRSEREKRILEALQNKIFRRSTYIPIQVHMVDSNRPLAMKALINCSATGEFIDHSFSERMNFRPINSHIRSGCIMQTDCQTRSERSPRPLTSFSNTKVTRASPNSMSRVSVIRQSSWDTPGLQSTTPTSTGAQVKSN